ncbi:MAG: hypothetical protein PHW63_01750 [Alphaproteobacteria bacterium]|nr:hypothetical protein [Alphaproteobacteria bacterium]
MHVRSFVVVLSLVLMASPALAGSVTYTDLRGKWDSTKCNPPQAMVVQGRDSEAHASALNSQMEDRNRFIMQAQDYMACISKEAQRDAEATGILVTKSAQALIDKTKAEIDAAMGPRAGQGAAQADKPQQ